MSEATIDKQQKLDVFRELMICSHTIYTWVYSVEGELLNTNCPVLAPHNIFAHTGCLSYAVEHLDELGAPLCLGAQLSLMWGAVLMHDEEHPRIYVIGPVLNNDIPHKTIEDAARRYVDDLTWREGFTSLLNGLPVVPNILFHQYILMLNYCVNDEQLSLSDIQFQPREATPEEEKKNPLVGDRHQTYMAERALLYCVRKGDLNYQSALSRAASLSTGIRVKTKDPVNQAVISVSGFITLCVRAAIEGGLSPDTAYTIGDDYIQSLMSCKSVSEVGAISHFMYEDFIRRVHKERDFASLSKPIRECREYIEQHLEEDLSLKALAKRAGYTEYYLSRKFKQEIGESVGDYIDYVRVERAKLLLETTNESISDIAVRLHYCSSTYFSNTFKAIVGILPSAFRKKKRVGQ